MIQEVKELRVKIDGLSQLVVDLKPIKVAIVSGYKNSFEIAKCYNSLLLAKAWLGKVLQELGQETPYANDGNRKEIKDIEPVADREINAKWYTVDFDFTSEPHLRKVDWLREEIKELISIIWDWKNQPQYRDQLSKGDSYKNAINTSKIYEHLVEARFHLGFELQRIKEEI